jgi:site-specific DNA recombinase
VSRDRVDGYVRVSRIGGRAGDGYISPEVQREQIEAFASLMGVEIDAWHDDQDYSGGNVARPAFLEVIRRIETGETGGVIVARIDRFARSAPDGGAMVRRILDAGGVFASAQERIDPTTDFGKAMLNIMFVMAELQLDQLKSGWKTAKGRAIGRGAHIGPTPFGYRRVPRGVEGSGTLVPDPGAGRAVSKLFRRAASGAGIAELTRYMDEISPRPDGGLWTTSSVGHLLANRVYLGEVSYGKDARNPRAHEPLVDVETWQAAQRERRPRKKRGSAFVLSGLVRCAACRYVMTGGPGGSSGHLRVYRCQGRHGGGRCPAPSMVAAERLERWVIEQVKALLAGSEVRAQQATDNAALARLAEAVSSAEAELDAFMLDLANRDRYGARYDAYLDARLRALEDAEAAYATAGSQAEPLLPAPLAWDELTPDELHAIVAGAVDAVFLRRPPQRGADVSERACIVWRGHAEDDLPGKGRPVAPIRPFAWPDELKATRRKVST